MQQASNGSVGFSANVADIQMEAGQLGLVPTRPLSQLGLGSTRPGQLGLFIFLMVNRDIIYVPNKKFDIYDMEYAR